MIAAQQILIVMEEMTDVAELARARVRRKQFDRNWAWFESHATEIYTSHRGRCSCIAGQELFVADTAREALELARSAHPSDEGRFTCFIPLERTVRIYAH
jgi:hypothetical protein